MCTNFHELNLRGDTCLQKLVPNENFCIYSSHFVWCEFYTSSQRPRSEWSMKNWGKSHYTTVIESVSLLILKHVLHIKISWAASTVKLLLEQILPCPRQQLWVESIRTMRVFTWDSLELLWLVDWTWYGDKTDISWLLSPSRRRIYKYLAANPG